jgi:hypothetical protein
VLGGFLERNHIDSEALARCLGRYCDERLGTTALLPR